MSCCGDTADGNFLAGCDACARSEFDSNRRWCTDSDRHCRSAQRNIGSGSPSRVTMNSKRNHIRCDEVDSSVVDTTMAATDWHPESTAEKV